MDEPQCLWTDPISIGRPNVYGSSAMIINRLNSYRQTPTSMDEQQCLWTDLTSIDRTRYLWMTPSVKDRPQCLWTDPMLRGRPQCLWKQRNDYKETQHL